ncbi:MAG: PIN domain-containing protein [Candidatus Aenigmarchaeota archaeon]|nr:PIN domain-containing protein [Candidatus Aenigmarchaeota archaeon]
MPKFVVDSWAWIEYLEGTGKGEKVREIVLDEKNEVYTNLINLSEIASVASRKSMDIDFAFNAVVSSSSIIGIDENFCKEAGKFHGKMRKKIRDFGMGDAFVAVTARKLNARILTGDQHFKGFKNATII